MEATQMSIDWWKSKMRYIHTMECYLASESKKFLTHAITWMNLEDTTVSEISQSQEDKYGMILVRQGT